MKKIITLTLSLASAIFVSGCGSNMPENFIRKAYIACSDHKGLHSINTRVAPLVMMEIECNDSFIYTRVDIEKKWIEKKSDK